MKKSTAPLAALAALGLTLSAPAFTGMAQAQGSGSTTYQADLQPLNHATGSGSLSLSLDGSTATVTEHVSGLAATFMDAPFPHVQHIHISAKGECPTMSADKNGDGVISTTEGGPSYGPIGTTLSVKGGTSPKDATNVKIAPGGDSFSYSRTIALSSDSVSQIKAGTAVIVVHGLDPATLSKKAQKEKSDLVPSLPLAATSPALCGSLQASQMGAVPSGGAGTGDGGSATGTSPTLEATGAAALIASMLALVFWRRSASQS
jgi:hypothetical protein